MRTRTTTDERDAPATLGRRLPADRPARPGPADHPRLGRLRHPGPRGAARPPLRLPGGPAAAVVPGRRRGGHRAAAGHLRRRPARRGRGDGDDEPGFSYVPIDPCQGVIAALRVALGERMARAFIDLETPRFEAHAASFPDPYALKRVSPEGFAAAVLPAIPPPAPGQHAERDRLDGRPAARAGTALSVDPVRLLAAGLALDPRRLPAPARGRRARAVLRADPDLRASTPGR